MASRIIRLKADEMIESKFEARLGNLELFFSSGVLRENTDKS